MTHKNKSITNPELADLAAVDDADPAATDDADPAATDDAEPAAVDDAILSYWGVFFSCVFETMFVLNVWFHLLIKTNIIKWIR